MADALDEAFDDPAERRAYEEFVAAQERGAEPFDLDRPALVCRWRMAGKHVPLLNRHIRALSQRRVMGAPLTHNMLSWAKQHVEWSLAEGDFSARDGVLMLVVDVNGNAAMSVGEYEPLADATLPGLVTRAEEARREAAQTGVAPEALCAVRDGSLIIGDAGEDHECGALTLIDQLAATRGLTVGHEALDELTRIVGAGGTHPFLVSDEHGVVPADGADVGDDPFVTLAIAGYAKLMDAAR